MNTMTKIVLVALGAVVAIVLGKIVLAAVVSVFLIASLFVGAVFIIALLAKVVLGDGG